MAVPSEMPSPYTSLLRKPVIELPQCSGLTVNDAALRSCHSRCSREDVTLSAMLTIWNGRQLRWLADPLSLISSPLQAWRLGHKVCMGGLSSGAKFVNGLGRRFGFDAPRKVRISRFRYSACMEKRLMLMLREDTRATSKTMTRAANSLSRSS